MNLQIICGALLVALAAILPGIGPKRWIWLPKIVFGLAGSLLVAWGAQVNSRRTTEEVQAKLQEVNAKIDSALVTSGDPSVRADLISTKAEFSNWAAAFESNRTILQLERQQSLLRRRADEITASKPPQQFLSLAVKILRGNLDAYAAHTNRRIEHKFPPIPTDVTKSDWAGSVSFTPKINWRIRFYNSEHGIGYSEQAIGYYVFDITVNPGGEPGAYKWDGLFSASIHRQSAGWLVTTNADNYFWPDQDLEVEDLSLDGIEPKLTRILQRLIELQILVADGSAQTG